MQKVLVIDNYDSFTYNLVDYVMSELPGTVDVWRNDMIDLDRVNEYDRILLSPGPGLPAHSGDMMKLIDLYHTSKPILGICLGMQALALHFGGRLIRQQRVWHGIPSDIFRTSVDEPVFSGLQQSFKAGRYHSWIVDETTLPDCYDITARDEDGVIMGIRHRSLDLSGVQFHPESIMTLDGRKLISNWLFHEVCFD